MNTLKRGSLSKIYIVVLILVIGYVLYNIGGSLITSDYKYKDFLNDMKNKNVSEITIKQNKEIPTGKIIVKLKNDETKSIYVSDVNKVSDDIEEINNNVGTDIRPYLEDVSRDSIFLTTVLPMILLGVVVLIVFMMMNANANGGGGKMANFGKSRAKMVIDIKNMDFSKVAGLEEEKEELEEIVDFLKNPKKYIDLGARTNLQDLGVFKITHYCPCSICCGPYSNGITSTGVTATTNHTIAVDPSVIPYGSKVVINGQVYVAEDCGGAIKKNRIDIYVATHAEGEAKGTYDTEVYLIK